jgi:hypothetical protein
MKHLKDMSKKEIVDYFFHLQGAPIFIMRKHGKVKEEWKLYPPVFEGNENQRQVISSEWPLDIEDQDQVDTILEVLEKNEISYQLWASGGDGSHTKSLFPEMKDLEEGLRPIVKEQLLYHLFPKADKKVLDIQKFGNKTLIQMENQTHHRKIYNKKTFIKEKNYGVNKIPKEVISKAKKLFSRYNAGAALNLSPIENPRILNFEKKCQAINTLIRRNNLDHRERLYLLIQYMKLGSNGEQRLREIFRQQQNYNPKITGAIIKSFKKKGKFYGMSCKKSKEWKMCPEGCIYG